MALRERQPIRRQDRCDRFLRLLALFMLTHAVPAAAADVIAPRIDLQVEPPAYAGLPVWLHVNVHDPCHNSGYDGDLIATIDPMNGFAPLRARAEIKRLDPAAEPNNINVNHFSSYVQPYMRWRSFTQRCASKPRAGIPRDDPFPLHVVADLNQPGRYAIRWVIPGIDQDSWLTFTVQPSTQTQRDAWLTTQLAHRPTDPNVLSRAYIPGILAAWRDPRTTRALLDILCDPDDSVSMTAPFAFPYQLEPAAAAYLIDHIEHGCMTRGLRHYLDQRYGIDAATRSALLHAAIAHLVAGDRVASAIEIISSARRVRHSNIGQFGPTDADDAVAADEAVRGAMPAVIGANDDTAKWALVEYLTDIDPDPRALATLRRLAEQPDHAAEMALLQLAKRATNRDLPWFTTQFAGAMTSYYVSNVLNSLHLLVAKFGPAVTPLLATVLQESPDAKMRVTAASYLAERNDPRGVSAMLAWLAGTDAASIAQILNGLAMTLPCTGDRALCVHDVRGETNSNAPWLAARKAAAIAYYQGKLTH
jgi:HEAT repeat protein